MALEEVFAGVPQLEPQPGFTKATVSAWRVTLEECGLGSSSIIIRTSAIPHAGGRDDGQQAAGAGTWPPASPA